MLTVVCVGEIAGITKHKLSLFPSVSEIHIKCVENYPDFEKLVHVIQHGLQGFIVKNTEGESTKATIHIL